MHYGRVHSKHIVNGKREQAVVRFQGDNGKGTAVALEEPPPKVDRRTREWRQAHPELAKSTQSSYWAGMSKEERSAEIKRRMKKARARKTEPAAREVTINYCPECGCHIKGVAMGMAVAAHMKG
jgi:hypothetical protein